MSAIWSSRMVVQVIITLLSVISMSYLFRPVSAVDRCADNGEDGFTCTRDILLFRERLDGRSIDVGVDQRIDGNEDEKKDILRVLDQITHYLHNEVLTMPEYEHVKWKCKNENELCAFWASVGECESNRVFMLSNCAAACRFCLLLNSGLV